jgi:hypothetical protein
MPLITISAGAPLGNLEKGPWHASGNLGTETEVLALQQEPASVWFASCSRSWYCPQVPITWATIAPRVCYSLNNFSFKVSSFPCLWILVPTAPYLVSIVQSAVYICFGTEGYSPFDNLDSCNCTMRLELLFDQSFSIMISWRSPTGKVVS